MRALRDNGLSIFFLAIFALALGFQTLAGWQEHNNEQLRHGSEAISYGAYVFSPEFGQALLENWQSEYLQFTLYILATVWLIQRGSPESKEPDETGAQSNREQKLGEHAEPSSPRWARIGGLRTRLYSNSLVILMATIWLASWFGHSLTGRRSYNSERMDHGEGALSYWSYLGSADFWETTCRTGSRSSWPWAPWPSSPSTCASVARPSRSPWAQRTA